MAATGSNLLSGKVAIVTGGAMGIGEAICRRFVEHGCRVVIADIAIEAAEALAEELGGGALPVQFDALRVETIGNLVEKAASWGGGLDILMNGVALTSKEALTGDRKVADTDLGLVDRIIAGNFTSYLAACRFAIPHMVRGGGGSIINIASYAGLVGLPDRVAYSASKAATISLTRSVAVQYGRDGIRCNAIAPGTILTRKVLELAPQIADLAARQVVLPRAGQPNDVAGAACFLASDLSSFVTGEILHVDGGMLAKSPYFADLVGAVQ